MTAEPTRIELRGLRVRGRHGVLAAERELGQDFVIDVALELDTTAAAASDDLTQTVDYAVLADRVAELVGGEPVALIETLAERIATLCLDDPRVRTAEVSVHKPQAPVRVALDDVVVSVRRSR